MLTYLFQYLDSIDVPGAGMFNYISFRAGLTFILSLIIATLYGRRIINYLQLKQIGEVIRDLGLEGQMSKKGTPTMGGVIIILAITIPVILFSRLDNIYILLMLFSTLWLGAIGFLDDYIKVFKKNKEGLKGKFKIVGQVGLGLIVGLTLYLSPQVVIRENVTIQKTEQLEVISYAKNDVKSTTTTIPFFKNNNLDYADAFKWLGDNAQTMGWIFFVLITIFIVTAVSNGANLTDGLDGLATGSSAIQGITLGILAYVSGNVNYAGYLNIMYIPGAGELVVFAAAFIGATVGFLWYNAFPAQVFMGDTGSLTLGGIIAVFAIIIHKELLIPILCGVFLVENLSVMMQVSYFKITKRKYGEGRRIFKMTPLHHHFQKPGNAGIQALIQKPFIPLPESKITVRFWVVGIILAALTIITLKMR
ncbi:MAG: phospho-N-acetylmuramoyl-pentapeptide-transferase [Paludibacteraceae bacterium]|nr:phospho-N-acetylmuramoyl-pentapeptide-transferase [Paludibacteraceae bacterium]MBN2788288.1 phospho-N-acetylmuramoyl-pentapeptide-transferase [Paludibacteraceae bacterium]